MKSAESITTTRERKLAELKTEYESVLKTLQTKMNKSVRKAIESYAASHGFDERAVAEIGLCVNEAMANVIRHAYRGRYDRPIHLAARMDRAGAGGNGQAIIVTLRDGGGGADPTAPPRREHDPLQPGGIGLICLRQWMDDVTFEPQPGGGVLTTMKRRKDHR